MTTQGRPLIEVLADPPRKRRPPTITAERKESLVRATGYSWSGLYFIARRAGLSIADMTDTEVCAFVRAHLTGARPPAPIGHRYDALGRLQPLRRSRLRRALDAAVKEAV